MIHSPRSVSTTSHPGLVQRAVQVDLLGGHRLRLHDQATALAGGDVDDELRRLGRGGRPVHVGADPLERGDGPVDPAVVVGQDLAPDRAGPVLAGRPRGDVGPPGRPHGAVALVDLAECLLEVGVADGGAGALLERRGGAVAVTLAHRRPSARTSAMWRSAHPRASASTGQVHEAAGVARHHRRRAGGGGVAELGVGHGGGDVAVLEGEGAAEAAAGLGIVHLDERGAGRPQEVGPWPVQPEHAQPVAGVVDGDGTPRRGGRQVGPSADVDEEAGQFVGRSAGGPPARCATHRRAGGCTSGGPSPRTTPTG